ncbi:hypothetical protein Cni_G23489 [Canna indica]|uniref:Protein RETICULATA-RELATED 3, chloroplastic n=1 Tax=Canna indica TaxID=4628 RepID=A0AAQ3KXB1_9LILI|nr:hypothetical protein Cni_G23489 [Canna indica]
MAAAAQLRLSSLSSPNSIRRVHGGTRYGHISSLSLRSSPRPLHSLSFPLLLPRSANPSLSETLTSTDLSGGGPTFPPDGPGNNGRGGGGDGAPDDDRHREEPVSSDPGGPLGLFIQGWRSRVLADPQFPFKVLMEELVGVTACVLGDMASRPNFGLNELDFVFCTLVVGSIVNFVLMYLLAPTAASAAAASGLPGIFASCPSSHMFETGSYSLFSRLGTFVYKGVTFAAVGFAAGLAGTAISNGLIALRKKMDPEFNSPNKPPPTVLNALTWALHMGLSSNFRYQTLNGVEFVMEKALPSAGFKASVVVLRCLNNVIGGMSFVALARITGSQKTAEVEEVKEESKEKLVVHNAMIAENGDEELGRK